jgi:hypothetical protein
MIPPIGAEVKPLGIGGPSPAGHASRALDLRHLAAEEPDDRTKAEFPSKPHCLKYLLL